MTTITVSPNPGSVVVGSNENFTAIGTFTDNSTLNVTAQSTWASSATANATVGASTGVVTGVAATTSPVTITATYGIVVGQTIVNVTTPPVMGGSSPTMTVPRYQHTATLLANGNVLLAGGQTSGEAYVDSADIYNPFTKTFSPTGTMTTARAYHTATLLTTGTNAGKVLIVGGQNGPTSTVGTAELYDPVAGTFSATGSPITPRFSHTATLLGNGKVLIVGGFNYGTTTGPVDTAEIYDPATGTFTATGSLITARWGHTATLLVGNGKVLISGGCGNAGAAGATCPLATSELYDPSAGTFSATGSLVTARYIHTATLLQSGFVLAAGGTSPVGPLASADLYSASGGTFAATGSLTIAREYATATLLNNGSVLFSGGMGPQGTLSSAELYTPGLGSFGLTTGNMTSARRGHTATLLSDGTVLITGGLLTTGDYLATGEIYSPVGGTFTLIGP